MGRIGKMGIKANNSDTVECATRRKQKVTPRPKDIFLMIAFS
jgi:hypothetical protein